MKQKAVDGARVERLAYSPAEVAAACGLSRKAIYRAIEIGELRAAKVCSGRRLLITVEELRAWIDRTVERAAPAPSRRVDDPAPRRAAARTPLGDALREIAAP
jgi:excisionase family DNA binding protein